MAKVELTIKIEGDEEEIQNIMEKFANALPEKVKIRQKDSLSDQEVRRLRSIVAANTPLC